MPIKNNQIEKEAKVLNAVASAPTVNTGEGSFYPKLVSGVVEGFYKDDQGNEIQLTNNGILNNPVVGEANTASNIGGGAGEIFSSKNGVDLEFRTIVGAAGGNVTVAVVGDQIQLSVPNSTGEVNTASNVGAGNQVFKQKTGVDLEFRTLVAGTNVTMVSSTDTITINAAGGGGSSLQVQDEGSLIDNAVTTLNFTGTGVTAAQTSPGVVQIAVAGGGSGETNTASNLGAGQGVFAQKSGVDLQFKSIVAGTNVSLAADANTITINAAGAAGETNTASNLGGSGEGIFAQKSSVDLQFKELIAGTNVSLSSDATGITINAAGAAGESNTASNLGAGEGLFTTKSGVDLPFKSLVAGTNVSLSSDANTVTINASGAAGETNTGSNLGTGEGEVFKQKNGVDFEHRTLRAGTNVTISQDANEITINSSGGGGSTLFSEFSFQLSAGASISARTITGLPAGWKVGDGTGTAVTGSGAMDAVASQLSQNASDLILQHGETANMIEFICVSIDPSGAPFGLDNNVVDFVTGGNNQTFRTDSTKSQSHIKAFQTDVGNLACEVYVRFI